MDAHRPRQRRALAWSAALTVAMMVAELVGSFVTGSLMLLSDAAHMLSHSISLGVSYVAIRMAARPRTPRSHYGLHRAEILGSFVNGLGLLLFTGWIVYEAFGRLRHPAPVAGLEMMLVAGAGLAVNLATVWILGRTGAEDLNTKSAFLHMLGDLFSSVVIVVGGLLLVATGWTWIDPTLSLVVALVVLWWGVGLVRESVRILLELAPTGVEPREIEHAMRAEIEGVLEIHDLHVWEITSGYVCLTAHVVVDDGPVSQTERVRTELCRLLYDRFQVTHVTLQLEAPEPAV
jgi:cobalt-zinc-cadmium efflux system protein